MHRLGTALPACATWLLLAALAACKASSGPQPQQATFAPGERVASSDALVVELSAARYDLRQISLTVRLTNRGTTPVSIEREGILLAYGGLEFPTALETARTTLPAGGSMELELAFVTEQLMVEAGALELLALRAGDDRWLAPLRLTVPPPAAFVEAAVAREDDEPR